MLSTKRIVVVAALLLAVAFILVDIGPSGEALNGLVVPIIMVVADQVAVALFCLLVWWWAGPIVGRMLCVVIGGIAVVAGLGTINYNQHLMQTGLRTTGIIVALQSAWTGHQYSFYPVVRFVLRGGQTYTVQSTVGANPPEFRQGEAVTVYYDPWHPQTTLIDSDRLWLEPLLWIVSGTVFGLASAWSLLRLLLGRAHTQTRKSNIRPRRNTPARRPCWDGG